VHRILWIREHVTPYTTNIMGKNQTWRPNTNNSIIQIRKTNHVAKCYIIFTCKEWKGSDLCGYVEVNLEVNRPLPSNEELLLSSDTPSSKCIWYGASAITGFSATSTQSKSCNKLRDSPMKAITRQKLLMVKLHLAHLVQAPPSCTMMVSITFALC